MTFQKITTNIKIENKIYYWMFCILWKWELSIQKQEKEMGILAIKMIFFFQESFFLMSLFISILISKLPSEYFYRKFKVSSFVFHKRYCLLFKILTI